MSAQSPDRYSTIVDANAAFARGDLATARRLYEQASSDTGFPAGPEPALQGFALFRLLLLHASFGEDDPARWVLEDMQELDESTGYPRLGVFFWHTYGVTNDLAATCAQVTELARQQPVLLAPLNAPGRPEYRAADLCQVPDVRR